MLYIIYKNKFKIDKDLNVRAKEKKSQEENMRISLYELGFGNEFLAWHWKHKLQKEWINWTSVKIENFSASDIFKKVEKTTHKLEEKTCKSYIR